MIILGNGFDLACGLPTSYYDFFKNRFEFLKNEYLLIEQLFMARESSGKENYEFLQVETNLRARGTGKYRDTRKKLENNLQADIIEIYNIVENTAVELTKSRITFWDLYFFSLHDVKNISDNTQWSNIETQIKTVITDMSSPISSPSLKVNPNQHLKLKALEINEYKKEYFLNILSIVSKDKVFKAIMAHYILKKSHGTDVYGFLFKELTLFERSFGDYISNIMKETKIVNSHSQIKYRDNLIKLVHHSNSENIYILNFNYTFFKANSSKKDINYFKQPFDIIRSKSNRVFKVVENNVHGKYNTSTIFGIDQDGLDNVDHIYMFTKTYRKMQNQEDIPSIEIPNPNEINEIVIYGHSLSEADYSYFQSLFDYYDIYRSSLRLTFKYSDYDDQKTSVSRKAKHLDSVIKLIKYYGARMFDDTHGKNLIHKLLLENRLKTEEITLQKINSKKYIKDLDIVRGGNETN